MDITPKHFSGKFLSTGSIVMDLPMKVAYLPERGGDVLAHSSGAVVGGGFNVVSAAARQGVPTYVLSPLGTGPNSAAVHEALQAEGIEVLVDGFVGDIGLCMALVEPDGLRTFVTTVGVEGEPQLEELERIQTQPGDCVYVSGYDLAYPLSAPVVSTWVSKLPAGVRLVMDIGPVIEEIPDEILETVLSRCNVLTMNRRERDKFAQRIGVRRSLRALREVVPDDCILLRRAGEEGCMVQVHHEAPLEVVPGFKRKAIDTTGAGDAHTGVLVASLMEGYDIYTAARRANAAAAIEVTRIGPATCPVRSEVEALLAAAAVESGSGFETYVIK